MVLNISIMKKYRKRQQKRISQKAKSINSSKKNRFQKDRFIAEAKIDPNYAKALSSVLMRPVSSEKEDTRHYNTKFISFADSQTINFMDAGVKNDFNNGDSVLFQGTITSKKGVTWLINSIKSALEKKDYVSFPFTPEISADLRTKYLLRTESSDSNEKLLADLSSSLRGLMAEEEIRDLFSCIRSAEIRFKKTPVRFVAPIDDIFYGKKVTLTKEEKEKLGFNPKSEISIDERSDDHDLVSLKDLIRVCNKTISTETTGLFAGSLNKYLPELKNLGYRGIVFEVEGKSLKRVRLIRKKYEELPFGPIEAATALLEYFEYEGKDPSINQGSEFYVSVCGYVSGAGKDKNLSHGYEKIYLMNEKVIDVSETFLFQKDNNYFSESDVAKRARKNYEKNSYDNEILCTRLYFYPNNPTDLHPLFQNHSLIFGASDHTFNSCAKGGDEFYNNIVRKMFSEFLENGLGDLEPGVKIARHLFLSGKTHKLLVEGLTYETLGRDVSDSIFGENKFTVEKYLYFMGLIPKMEKLKSKIEDLNLLKNCHPLTTRFIYFNYIKDKNGGLVKDPQFTTIRQAIKRHDPQAIFEELAHGIKVVNGLNKFNDLINKGIKIQEAWDSSFDEKTKERLSKK